MSAFLEVRGRRRYTPPWSNRTCANPQSHLRRGVQIPARRREGGPAHALGAPGEGGSGTGVPAHRSAHADAPSGWDRVAGPAHGLLSHRAPGGRQPQTGPDRDPEGQQRLGRAAVPALPGLQLLQSVQRLYGCGRPGAAAAPAHHLLPRGGTGGAGCAGAQDQPPLPRRGHRWRSAHHRSVRGSAHARFHCGADQSPEGPPADRPGTTPGGVRPGPGLPFRPAPAGHPGGELPGPVSGRAAPAVAGGSRAGRPGRDGRRGRPAGGLPGTGPKDRPGHRRKGPGH